MCVSDLRVETGSCGRTRVAGSTTGSGRKNKLPRAGRSSFPYMVMTSETGAGLETDPTDSDGLGTNKQNFMIFGERTPEFSN